jgi:hypothetical protein
MTGILRMIVTLAAVVAWIVLVPLLDLADGRGAAA